MEGIPRTPDTPPSVLKVLVAQRPGLLSYEVDRAIAPRGANVLNSRTAVAREVGVAAKVLSRLLSQSLRPVQHRRPPRHGLAPALEGVKHRGEFRDRHFRALRIEHDEIGGLTDSEPVVLEPEHLRGPPRHHVEALPHVGLLPDLTDVGVEVCHPHLRAVPERRERIQYVVARQRTLLMQVL
jgi:hypothetical protein